LRELSIDDLITSKIKSGDVLTVKTMVKRISYFANLSANNGLQAQETIEWE